TVTMALLGPVFILFFQAEDGIRERNVTGVQTCALPSSGSISFVWTVETPWGPGPLWLGRPTARKAQPPSGNRAAQEANAGSRKGTGKRCVNTGLSVGGSA